MDNRGSISASGADLTGGEKWFKVESTNGASPLTGGTRDGTRDVFVIFPYLPGKDTLD